jgi:hypothetical protein
MQHQDTDVVFVGDLVRQAASDCYRRLIAVIEAAAKQTPELRYEKLKSCIQRMKKHLSMMYAILIWLKEDNVQKFLSSVKLITGDMRQRSMHLNFAQDSLYFFHRSLFQRRIASLDVAFAADIIGRATYAHLPTEMFAYGDDASKPKRQRILVDNATLNICIGSKIRLHHSVPRECDIISIQNGQLTMGITDSFEATLSLSFDSDLAPWKVVRCAIQVKHDSSLRRMDTIGRKNIEKDLFSILQVLLAERQKQIANPLEVVCNVCSHVASSAVMKLLYVQALDISRANIYGEMKVDYSEDSSKFLFGFNFWGNRRQRCV